MVRFSIYTDIQVEVIKRMSSEILELLDQSMSGEGIDGQGFQRIYGLYWLWVLGVYEIVRTMNEYKDCFSGELQLKINTFKARITVLRIPFAKQQLRGRNNKIISNENSVYSTDLARRDMSFQVEGTLFSVREMIAEFDVFMSSIADKDVLRDMRESGKS